MVKGNQGDAFIELVRFTKDGPIIETLNTYGASARKNSPHYTDQMEMFTKQQTKPMTLNKAEVYKNAEKIYHPK
jgi:acyl-homoserine-lactone acylase